MSYQSAGSGRALFNSLTARFITGNATEKKRDNEKNSEENSVHYQLKPRHVCTSVRISETVRRKPIILPRQTKFPFYIEISGDARQKKKRKNEKKKKRKRLTNKIGANKSIQTVDELFQSRKLKYSPATESFTYTRAKRMKFVLNFNIQMFRKQHRPAYITEPVIVPTLYC